MKAKCEECSYMCTLTMDINCSYAIGQTCPSGDRPVWKDAPESRMAEFDRAAWKERDAHLEEIAALKRELDSLVEGKDAVGVFEI